MQMEQEKKWYKLHWIESKQSKRGLKGRKENRVHESSAAGRARR